MRTKLKAGEYCPLHRSYSCECHGPKPAWQPKKLRNGPVTRIEDPHHPRGYREICTPAELRRRKHRLIAKDPTCYLCMERFTDYGEIDLGSARRDDHWDNLALAHHVCNLEKGSNRL